MFKEKKYEKYLLLALSILAIALGILILCNCLNVIYKDGQLEGKNKYLFGGILIACGVLALYMSIKEIKKSRAINKYSVFNNITKMYQSNEITDILIQKELIKDFIYYEVDDLNEALILGYKKKLGNFTCHISKEEVTIMFEYNENYLENKPDEEIDKLPLINELIEFSALHINENEVFEKFVSFIKTNEINLEELE